VSSFRPIFVFAGYTVPLMHSLHCPFCSPHNCQDDSCA